MRIVEVVTDCGHADTLSSIAEQHEVDDHWRFEPRGEAGRCVCRMLVRPERLQEVVDALQTALEKTDNSRIVISRSKPPCPVPRNPTMKKSAP